MSNRPPIESFTGRYTFLSNFYVLPAPLFYFGDKYRTVENAFQAAKAISTVDKRQIGGAWTPSQAKALGRKIKIRPDWDEVKLDIMQTLVRIKFQDSTMRRKLYDTGDAELVEGNYWNDTYWGVCQGTGENHLGKILMRVRGELQ